MKIRFFNTHEPVSSHYRDLLPILAANGHTVEVLLSTAEYRAGGKVLESVLKHPGIRVVRIPAGIARARNAIEKLRVMLTYALGSGFRSLMGPPVDMNVFLTQPPIFFFLGCILKLIRRQKYCCLIMDLYPDVLERSGLLPRDSLAAGCLRRVCRTTLRRADKVIVIGRCMRDYVIKEGVPAQRVVVIENWVNEKEVYHVPLHENTLRRSLGLSQHFVVVYSGNVGMSHYFDDLIEVCRRWRDVEDFAVVVFGGGGRLNELEKAKRDHGLSRLVLMPFQPAERRSEAVGFGDLSFISLRDGFEGLVVPSKAYGALAAGWPILYQGNPGGEIARMVEEENVGVVVPPGDPDALEKSIRSYYEDRQKVLEQGRRARQIAAARYGRSQAIEKFLRVLQGA